MNIRAAKVWRMLRVALWPLVLLKRAVERRQRTPPNIAKRLFKYDRDVFMKHAGAFARSREAKLAAIVMGYHVVEKGLTMPRRRLGFGRKAVLDLIRRVDAFETEYGRGDSMVDHAAGVVNEYFRVHKEAQWSFAEDMEFNRSLKDFVDSHADIAPCRQRHVTKERFFSDVESPFPIFAASRHTCRYFKGEVPLLVIEKAVEIAMTAPSACNRQHVRVHCVTDHKQRDLIYTYQNGNRGFGADADKLLVIASDLNDVRWVEERNDIYTNAGMFLMNLCYALHYMKVAHCVLNWSVSPECDHEIHSLLSIHENERIVALCACGGMPEEADIAASPRKRIEDVYIVH